MLQFEELRLRLLGHEDALKDLADALGLEKMKKEIEELDAKTAENGFWDDIKGSQVVLKRQSSLKNKVNAYEKLKQDYDDALVMISLQMRKRMKALLKSVKRALKKSKTTLNQ